MATAFEEADLAEPDEARVVAWQGAGLSEALAEEAKRAIVAKFAKCDRAARVRTVRFLPTTRSFAQGDGLLEILTHVTAEFGDPIPQFGFPRSRVMQAVVTFSGEGDRRHLEKVVIIR